MKDRFPAPRGSFRRTAESGTYEQSILLNKKKETEYIIKW